MLPSLLLCLWIAVVMEPEIDKLRDYQRFLCHGLKMIAFIGIQSNIMKYFIDTPPHYNIIILAHKNRPSHNFRFIGMNFQF